MNILSMSHIFNEALYLEDSYDYLKSQGVNKFLYIDNMSTDNTQSMLGYKSNITCSKFDTQGSFHLRNLQDEMMRIVHKIKPDWVIYTDPDLFYVYDGTIKEEIEKAEAEGCNQISTMCWGGLNTGEKVELPLRKHFFYGVPWKPIIRLTKYNKSLKANGDNLMVNNSQVYASNGVVINYGGCKTAIDQDEKLDRINKARKQGQRAGIGQHYAKYQALGYKWNKEDLKDLRNIELFKKLIEYGS